jgi:2-hydroxychromene-2-carboxylate isomerase
MKPLRFWFEFASTYSYLGAMRVENLARIHGVPFEWKAFLLGPIFRNQGWNDSPFNLNPVRGRYMWRDVERLCGKYGLPFRKPGGFPRKSVLAARVACAGAGREWLPAFVRATFRANFAEDRDIADAGVIEEVLRSVGQDGAAVLALAQSQGNKDLLRRQTDEAWALGIFGAPTCEVEGELFWGHDRIEDAFAWDLERRRHP